MSFVSVRAPDIFNLLLDQEYTWSNSKNGKNIVQSRKNAPDQIIQTFDLATLIANINAFSDKRSIDRDFLSRDRYPDITPQQRYMNPELNITAINAVVAQRNQIIEKSLTYRITLFVLKCFSFGHLSSVASLKFQRIEIFNQNYLSNRNITFRNKNGQDVEYTVHGITRIISIDTITEVCTRVMCQNQSYVTNNLANIIKVAYACRHIRSIDKMIDEKNLLIDSSIVYKIAKVLKKISFGYISVADRMKFIPLRDNWSLVSTYLSSPKISGMHLIIKQGAKHEQIFNIDKYQPFLNGEVSINECFNCDIESLYETSNEAIESDLNSNVKERIDPLQRSNNGCISVLLSQILRGHEIDRAFGQ